MVTTFPFFIPTVVRWTVGIEATVLTPLRHHWTGLSQVNKEDAFYSQEKRIVKTRASESVISQLLVVNITINILSTQWLHIHPYNLSSPTDTRALLSNPHHCTAAASDKRNPYIHGDVSVEHQSNLYVIKLYFENEPSEWWLCNTTCLSFPQWCYFKTALWINSLQQVSLKDRAQGQPFCHYVCHT